MEQVLQFAKDKGLFDCGIIVTGLSGGPDSVALLTILKELKDNKDIDCDIRAFHCNHHLRPGVCDEEAEMVRKMCADLGVDLKTIDFDCAGFAMQNYISEETAGRLLRYEAFEQYAQALEKETGREVRIAIAHHKDDVAETMMMNLFRGAGLEGLVNPKSHTGRIIRPLLCLKKSELVDFLEDRGIKYAVDQTNLTTEGTRNTWRNDLLPRIGGHYRQDPAVPLNRTYKLLSDDLDYIGKASEDAYKAVRETVSGYPVLKASETVKLHPAIRSRVIRSLWNETFGDLIDFEEVHLNGCCKIMERDASGELTIDMPFGRKAYRFGDVFGFAAMNKTTVLACAIAEDMGYVTCAGPAKTELRLTDIAGSGEYVTDIPNSALKIKALRIENEGALEYNNLLWFCPADAVSGGILTIGNCEGLGTGFHMRKAGAQGGKELNRLMTDLKIPESARKQIVFAVNGEDVMWLPGFGHAAGFTDDASRNKFIASTAGRGSEPEMLVMFKIEGK